MIAGDLNIDTSKSYATEANLKTALAKLGFDKFVYVIVRNRECRWTAIFPFKLNEAELQGNVMLFARHGFRTVS